MKTVIEINELTKQYGKSKELAAYKKRVEELAEIIGIKDALFKPIKNLSDGMHENGFSRASCPLHCGQ